MLKNSPPLPDDQEMLAGSLAARPVGFKACDLLIIYHPATFSLLLPLNSGDLLAPPPTWTPAQRTLPCLAPPPTWTPAQRTLPCLAPPPTWTPAQRTPLPCLAGPFLVIQSLGHEVDIPVANGGAVPTESYTKKIARFTLVGNSTFLRA